MATAFSQSLAKNVVRGGFGPKSSGQIGGLGGRVTARSTPEDEDWLIDGVVSGEPDVGRIVKRMLRAR